VTFTRVVVWPNGHREIEGVTPKQLPAPSSHTLPDEGQSERYVSDISAGSINVLRTQLELFWREP
jgi:hypothetical protein